MGCWWRDTETKTKNLGQFLRNCPHCMRETHWTCFQVTDEEKLYSFIPCGSSDKGEFVQCNICGAQYATRKGKSNCC